MKARPSTLLLLGSALTLVACANIGPPEPPSLELPKPPLDLRATRKGSKVTLTWTVPSVTTDRQTLRSVGPTLICRGTQPDFRQCGTAAGEAPARSVTKKSGEKITDSYTDTLPGSIESDDPASFVTYAVEVLNTEKRSAGLSDLVRVPRIRTLLPPGDFQAKVTSNGVVLTWTAQPTVAPEGVRYIYRVYRRDEGGTESTLAGERAPSETCCALTDANIEWEKTYKYRVQAVTIVSAQKGSTQEVAGDDSQEIKVFADDIFPPSVPSGVQAAFSGPGQQAFVDLIWAPDTDADLAGYNVYRREENTTPVKLNSEIVKTAAYRDTQITSGKTYFYSVSAVDLRGNESQRSEETSENVPAQ